MLQGIGPSARARACVRRDLNGVVWLAEKAVMRQAKLDPGTGLEEPIPFSCRVASMWRVGREKERERVCR